MIKNITDLRNELLKREAGKKQVNAAQMNEILRILSDLVHEDPVMPVAVLLNNGKRRAKARKKS
jgi:hypothetical protein